MPFLKSLAPTLALVAAVFALPASASTIVPAVPLPFELVNLRMTVDSCAFNPSTVFVTTTAAGIEVRMRENQCFAAGTPKEVDIRLGEYPVGTYAVVVSSLSGDIATVRERLQFTVPPRAEIAIFPPPAHPLTDYTGLWFDPAQPGWGVSIHQNPSDSMFVASFEYAGGAATWYTFQSGRWTSSTAWQGTAYRTTFPPLFVVPLGGVSIDFDAAAPAGAPAGSRWARITHPLPDGTIVTKLVTRQPF